MTKTTRPVDGPTQEMRAIRERLAQEPVWFQRTVDAWAESQERNERWRRNCPPEHRQGHHLPLQDGYDRKSEIDRVTEPELKAERFTHAGMGDHRTTVSGLLDVGSQTITRNEWRLLYGKKDSNPAA